MLYSALNGDFMVQKGVFWTMGDTHILLSYPLVYSCMMKGIEGLNNGTLCRGVIDSINYIG